MENKKKDISSTIEMQLLQGETRQLFNTNHLGQEVKVLVASSNCKEECRWEEF